MRLVMILLLIASIFSCPYRCAIGGGCANTADATQVVVGGDSCCKSCVGEDVQGDQTPQPECPCDDCDCVACICNGATVDGDSGAADVSAAEVVLLAVESYQRFSEPRPARLSSAGQILQGSLFVSGRTARISLQSFQI
ncbi:hypothetical protein CA85_24820 [Allorhodopirellula solitaria]|uniref:Uncharacterized protein n=1 Tax=Allorhodopirellula solitaria TaxID=2527987 RepID=A0A5C5XUJ3_9BACT|nr:hypothetical protein CA85_24820 [Allorhodopirellula solitaria]